MTTSALLKEAATRFVRRRSCFGLTTWSKLLWSLALLGLFLLPADYRAGAGTAHGHSLVQLWIDAHDGAVQHTHDGHRESHLGAASAPSWLDPLVDGAGSAGSTAGDDERPDTVEQQESAPAPTAIHLLLTSLTVLLAIGVRQTIRAGSDRPVAGLPPRVVLPPPRWTPGAA